VLDFRPIEPQVLSADEAVQFLALDSTRALERLVQARRLTPLKLGKRLVYAKIELTQLIDRELRAERRLRGTDDGQDS
jgi:hypothetical protein